MGVQATGVVVLLALGGAWGRCAPGGAPAARRRRR